MRILTVYPNNWTSEGVTLPNGTKLAMAYRDQFIRGKVKQGKIEVGDELFDNLSDAAKHKARTANGTRVSALNGWLCWAAEVNRNGRKLWVPVAWLRSEAQGAKLPV